MIFYKGNRLTGKQSITANQVIADFYNQGRHQMEGDFETLIIRHCMQYGSHDTFGAEDWDAIHEARLEYLREERNTFYVISKGRKYWVASSFRDAFIESGLKRTDDYIETIVTTGFPKEQVAVENGKVIFLSKFEGAKRAMAKRTPKSPHKNRVKTREELINEVAKLREKLELLNS